MGYKYAAINGTVISIEDRHLPTGKYLAVARIQDEKGKIWCCTFWDDQADELIRLGLLNKDIYVEGGLKEENAVGVKFFNGKRQTAPAKLKEEEIQGEEKVEYIDAGKYVRIRWTDKRGLKTYREVGKDRFVKVNGSWEPKMEYCIRVMGSEEVLNWLRGSGAGLHVGGNGAIISLNVSAYKERLQLMVDACQGYTGDYLEYCEENNEKEDTTTTNEAQG